MGVTSYDFEVSCPVSPARLLKAVTVEAPNVWPKAAPHLIKNIEVEGEGKPGSIVKINFAEGHPIGYVKEMIGGLDEDNLSYSYSVVEGGPLGGKLEKISYENKFVSAANGGTTVKSLMKYHTTGDSVYTEDEHKAFVGRTQELYKAVEAYLVANPDDLLLLIHSRLSN